MNWTQILSLVLQAAVTRSVAFAATIGSKHLAVTITQTGAPGNSGSFWNILGVVGQIMAGQPGTFQIGVFQLVVQELVTAPAPAPQVAPQVAR